jgi:hypothetical protein
MAGLARQPTPNFVMAGLDPATQLARVGATEIRVSAYRHNKVSPVRTDVRTLGGRVKPGHDGEVER